MSIIETMDQLVPLFIVALPVVLFVGLPALMIALPYRARRKEREQAHRHELELLRAKHDHELRLAAALKDPVQLLALDPNFGADFDRRLREAIDSSGKQAGAPRARS